MSMEFKQNEKPSEKPKENEVETKDDSLFGKLLKKAFNALPKEQKNKAQIARKLKLKHSKLISDWEEGAIFPKKEMLEAIATAYEITDSQELIKAWETSKKAREMFKMARNSKSSRKSNDTDVFWSGGSGRRVPPRGPRY